ncbi:MAG TPA: hypothetical protein VE869_17340 [Gemmatimonas sp.]|nr:hypothetical protein [Gemmatimonas sp.]
MRSSRSGRRGSVPLRQLLVALLVIGTIVYIGKRQAASAAAGNDVERVAAEVVAGTDTAPSTAPTAAESVGAFRVRTVDNAIAPLAVPGKATIVMISSLTCGWCKRALADLGEMSAGRPLPNLTLLTLEGAADGLPMLQKEGITGARLVGPAGGNETVMLTFRYPGTPTFVAIDRNGRVVRTMPGYPIREEMKHWYAVMVGDQETP